MSAPAVVNSASEDLDKCVIWQYDKSEGICAFADFLKEVFDRTCADAWDRLPEGVTADEADLREFVISLLASIVGIPRMSVTVGETTAPVSLELFSRIVIGKFALCARCATPGNYLSFMEYVFGSGNVSVSTGNEMDMEVRWKDGVVPTTDEDKERKAVADNWASRLVDFPTGVRDNDKASGLRFWMGESRDDAPEEGVGGGLDESSFSWK